MKTPCPDTEDFFRRRLDHMIDLNNPLAVLSSRLPWQELESQITHVFSRRAKRGETLKDLDCFGERVEEPTRVSRAGRPRIPLRIMISLLYLKHAYNMSDEALVERWAESPRWQFFSGMTHYEERLPCDATTLVKFRRLLGEDGCEALLAQTIESAVTNKLISKQSLESVVVDTTVQEKAIAYPSDSRSLEVVRGKLVQAAKTQGIELKQTFAKEGKTLSYQAGRYAHAKQFNRMRKVIKRQCTVVSTLVREIKRKAAATCVTLSAGTRDALDKATRLVAQAGNLKNKNGPPKLYAFHAPEVVCISKGKSRGAYEFGAKVGVVMTLKGNLVVGCKAFEGNPYDGDALKSQIEQSAKLMQRLDVRPHTAFVDLGYRGVDADNPDIAIKHRGKNKQLTNKERKLLKRRQAVEPVIGHIKHDCGMERCHLKGSEGDRIHAVLCAAGYNIRWLLRMIAKKGLTFLKSLFLRLCTALGISRLWVNYMLSFALPQYV